MKQFAIIGVGGYIAPRHLRAIKESGNCVVAALDLHDSVGILDSYFPDASFFTEFERFDRHLEKLRRGGEGQAIDYVTICSPNYLHDAHVRFALRIGADAICEKPLVLNPWNISALKALADEHGRTINTILQLRMHKAIQALKNEAKAVKTRRVIDLTYITARGKWYQYSWKGVESKSGGVIMNIGIHFFDMLLWLFGPVKEMAVHVRTPSKAIGTLRLQDADVNWQLSIDHDDLPDEAVRRGQRTYRSLMIDGKELEFSEGFTELHTDCYREILRGNGHSLEDVRPSIELVHRIRCAEISPQQNGHSFKGVVEE